MEVLEKAKRISQLDTVVSNQIAAGEVIERPYSVVKELLENSLDSDAKQVDLKIEKGGLSQIQITDDGVGIHPKDLKLALSRHATSKLVKAKDLEEIETLGFRGEALASIASVSKTEIVSRLRGSKEAFKVFFDPRENVFSEIIPAGHKEGTTVTVQELFYTVPARKAFLKSERTEFLHIETLVKKIALANYGVGFRLYHQDKLILNYPKMNQNAIARRVQDVLGPKFLSQAVEVEHSAIGLHAKAWFLPPGLSRSQADSQYLYLNGRMIKDKLIMHAIREAYSGELYPGRHPVFVLFFECTPNQVDVNVHPTKHEVRFRQARLVYDFISRTLELAMEKMSSVIGVEATEVEETKINISGPEKMTPKNAIAAPQPMSSPVKEAFFQRPKAPVAVQSNSWLPLKNEPLFCIGQYLITKNQDKMLVINVQNLFASRAFSSFKARKEGKDISLSPRLLPETLTLTMIQVKSLREKQSFYTYYGFDYTFLSDVQVVVREVPTVLAKATLCSIMGLPTMESDEDILKEWSVRAYSGEAHKLSDAEKQSLIQQAISEKHIPDFPLGPAWRVFTCDNLTQVFRA